MSARSTRHEKRGLKGQPCGNPSSCLRYFAVLCLSKYHWLHVCVVKRSNSGTSCVVASFSNNIFLASVLLMLLNMLVKLSMTRARLGGLLCSVSLLLLEFSLVLFGSMYWRTTIAVVWATKALDSRIVLLGAGVGIFFL